MNELILILSMVLEFGLVVLSYRLFGRGGLFGMTVFCTLAANIEVMILVEAFGMEQTLGNVLFAASFLITDILSENEGKKQAQRAVNLGIFVSVAFILVSRSWLLYTPAPGDGVMDGIRTVFSNTPRVMLSSLAVYAVTQKLDVMMYHKWWAFTEKKFGDSRRFMWVRNNCATLVAQLINTVLFNLLAFWGTYPAGTILSIILSGYLIFIVTSLADTPFLYLSRWLKDRGKTDKLGGAA